MRHPSSNKFYELIPHKNYQTTAIPSLNNQNVIVQKIRLLEQLIDCEVVSKIILGAIKNKLVTNPLQYCYSALNIRMIQLEKNHAEYSLIIKYLQNGLMNENTSDKFVNNVFAMERKGEPERMLHQPRKNNK